MRAHQDPNRLHVDEKPAGVATTVAQKYTMEGIDHPDSKYTMEGVDYPGWEDTVEGIDHPVQRPVKHSRQTNP